MSRGRAGEGWRTVTRLAHLVTTLIRSSSLRHAAAAAAPCSRRLRSGLRLGERFSGLATPATTYLTELGPVEESP